MTLAGFVTQLLQAGSVVLSPVLVPFGLEDLAATGDLLEKYHRWDAMNMPLQAPDFDARAAVWAAQYLCRALQFVMVRNLGEELMQAHLKAYDRPIDAAAAYSADLCLRYLPTVFNLAKGLSPTDPLVTDMTKNAEMWPFSTIGIQHAAEFAIDHPSLKLAYADRILAAMDRKRSRQPVANLQLQAALGAHAKRLWPDFEPLNAEEIDNARSIEH